MYSNYLLSNGSWESAFLYVVGEGLKKKLYIYKKNWGGGGQLYHHYFPNWIQSLWRSFLNLKAVRSQHYIAIPMTFMSSPSPSRGIGLFEMQPKHY